MEMCGNAKDKSRAERSAGLSPLAHKNRPRSKPCPRFWRQTELSTNLSTPLSAPHPWGDSFICRVGFLTYQEGDLGSWRLNQTNDTGRSETSPETVGAIITSRK